MHIINFKNTCSMENLDYKELLQMLVVIYKRLDELERKVKGNGWRSAPDETYLKELRKEAEKINVK
ncbi:MAG: hypothetical protein PHP81_02985 [Patescibacteria group bacterium]|nr:hypothetical protein [Patescibacteria group bacterium]